jgi:3-dehydroquinate synthase
VNTVNEALSVRDHQPIPRLDGPIVSSVRRTSTYRIHVTRDDDSTLRSLAEIIGERRVALVTDDTVDRLYARDIGSWLASRGTTVHTASIAPGESSKSLSTASDLLDWLAQTDTRRRDILLAVGGGVIIDTVGWVASAYMRGIAYVNVPTTLLAQVDAAIGGKVAVNHAAAKNLIGGFYAPLAVVSCTDWLSTLGPRQIRSGLAEVVKVAVISSPQLLTYVEEQREQLLNLDPSSLRTVVYAATAVKCALVERDPFEVDLRRTLNFGHTVGHAVETVTGYGPVLHGEAVAYGMAVALRIAMFRRVLDAATGSRIIRLLRALGLPVTPEDLSVTPSSDEVIAALEMVRHVRDGSLRFVLPTDLGAALIVDDVTDDEIRNAMCGRMRSVRLSA